MLNAYFVTAVIFKQQGLSHKETPLVIEIVNFAVESFVFQYRLLNGTHFISDIKLPCFPSNKQTFHAKVVAIDFVTIPNGVI